MCSGAFPAVGGLPGERHASIAAQRGPTGSQGASVVGGAVCRIVAVDCREDVRNSTLPGTGALMKKGAMVPVLARCWKRFRPFPPCGGRLAGDHRRSRCHAALPVRASSPASRLLQKKIKRVAPAGCAFLPCTGAKVLPRGTFGAFVSEYFSNPDLAWGFGGLSVKTWPKALQGAPLLSFQKRLTNAFSRWRAYCQQESADCSDA